VKPNLKCEHISGVPLRPSVARQLHMIYLAKGVLATTAIEGNTLTESEVLQHLEGKLELPPSKEYLSKEIDNIIEACDKISADIFIRNRAELSVEKLKIITNWFWMGLPWANRSFPDKSELFLLV